jgi:hypothetical protein
VRGKSCVRGGDNERKRAERKTDRTTGIVSEKVTNCAETEKQRRVTIEEEAGQSEKRDFFSASI